MKDFKKLNLTTKTCAVSLRQSRRWRNLSKHIRLKYLYQCQAPTKCNSISKEVHHILPAINYPQFFFEDWNLIPLCKECHSQLGMLQGTQRQELLTYWKQTTQKHTITPDDLF